MAVVTPKGPGAPDYADDDDQQGQSSEGKGNRLAVLDGLAEGTGKDFKGRGAQKLQERGVEDNPATRSALCSTLETLNYHTFEAANGKEALTLFAQHRTDIALVLTDLVMPVMGGKALAQALYQQAPDISIIVMSGHPLDPKTDVRITDSVRDWMQKPPSLEQLAEMLARVLHR